MALKVGKTSIESLQAGDPIGDSGASGRSPAISRSANPSGMMSLIGCP